MFSLIWQLIKLIKHALPFLNEVTNPNDARDEKDQAVINHLRTLIRTALWRVLMVAIFSVVTLYVVIPLHTENAVLRQENIELEDRIKYLRERLESAQASRDETNKQVTQLEIRLMNRDSELKGVRDNLEHCYKVGCGPTTKVIDLPKPKSTSSTTTTVKPKPVTSKPPTVKLPQGNNNISKTVSDRLDNIN